MCFSWLSKKVLIAEPISFFFFFLDFIYLFLERAEGKEKEGEKHQCMVASHMSFAGDLACKPGMCLDWESNSDPLVCKPALNPLSYTSQAEPISYPSQCF